jgi:hypothetical protein
MITEQIMIAKILEDQRVEDILKGTYLRSNLPIVHLEAFRNPTIT